MREIKFRAWDKKNKIMFYDVQDEYQGVEDGVRIYSDTGEMSFGHLLDNDDFIVMQWTGLKDKNGMEVYEGDLILAPSVELKIPVGDYECTVEWEGAGFYAKHENGVGECLENLIEVRGGVVIGNIWEGKKAEGTKNTKE